METQTVEWKKEWKDEFLKEIASFANTRGGILKVGVDDDGRLVGVKDPKDVMKKISDTVANKLSLFPVIEIDEDTAVITVTVEKSSTPVDLNGRFYVRSGNTVHEARGREFDRLMSKRLNMTWIDQPMDGMDESELDPVAMAYFRRKAKDVGLISESSLSVPDGELLVKLGLKVGDSITRAGVMLFHPAPEDVITGSFTKVGMFEGSELLHQDIIGGPLVTRLDRILDVMSVKYLVRPITYDGWVRIENDPYPKDSLRECLLNALIHNEYSSFNPVQIRMWKDRMMVSDSGGLPDGWTIDGLLSEHRSEPVNPRIAYVFFLMGLIENWGRGIERIRNGYGNRSDRRVTFKADMNRFQVNMDAVMTLDDISKGESVKNRSVNDYSDRDLELLRFMDVPEGRGIGEIVEFISVSSKASVSRMYIRPMINHGLIEYTIPEKPTSKYQKYRTTDLGKRLMLREV